MITNECNWMFWGIGSNGLDKVPFHFSRDKGYYFPMTKSAITDIPFFSFKEAKNIKNAYLDKENKYGILKGIGYHFNGSKYVGIDLDNVFLNGKIRPIFEAILKPVMGKTYIEYSPSKKGLHFFLEKDLELKQYNIKFDNDISIDEKLIGSYDGEKTPGIDMYLDSKSKYFTYTGNKFEGSTDQIQAKLSDFKKIYDRLIYYLDLKKKKEITQRVKNNTQYKFSNSGKKIVDNVFSYIKKNVNIADGFKFYTGIDVTYRNKHICPLSYHRAGSKALLIYQDGYFNCESCEKKGSIIDLVGYLKNCDGKTACKIINNDFNLDIKINW